MKHTIAIAALCAAAVLPLAAHEEHEKKSAGPNGGRIVTSTEPHYELLVTADRKMKLTFLGTDNKTPVSTEGKSATATGGDRTNPVKFSFAIEGNALVSDKPLPEGTKIPLVLQVKTTADGKPATERINVNLADCSECGHKEYACTCAHEH